MTSWRDSVALYRDRRILAILFMGFSSGLPLALTLGTLSIWLREDGVTLKTIGFFSLAGLSYNLKFLWAPLADRAAIPFLTAKLGRRRSWAIAIQIPLALAILSLGLTDPQSHAIATALVAVIVAFLSASQDIVIDAYRVELLTEDEQGDGAAATQLGYSIGMIASSAGALYLAQYFGWRAAYAVMAGLMSVGIVTVLMTREPQAGVARRTGGLREAVIDPFLDFAKRRDWLLILIFVVLYKLGDAIAGKLSGPFYIDLGFEKSEIANISKVFGTIAVMVGVVIGGTLATKIGAMKALLIGGVLQSLSNLMYIVQLRAGHDLLALTGTIATENITGGMASAAMVAFLSRLCSVQYTATQYALLSALATLPRTLLTAPTGTIVDLYGWQNFFLAATAACLPGLMLLLWLIRRDPLARAAAD